MLDWFGETGLEFVRSVPSFAPDPDDAAARGLFAPEARGSKRNRAWSQARQVVTGSREGGFFIMIARRPPSTPDPLGDSTTHAGHQLEPVSA